MKAYNFLEFLNLPIQTNEIHSEEEFAFSYIAVPTDEIQNTNEYISKVKIPMIQRDYAQGRDDKEELRKQFVDDLFKAAEEQKELKLDFIYGSISKDKSFLPLDGQQRLTTLFLLHWLVLKIEVIDDKNKYLELLKKFSYETRDTARKFFQKLVQFEFTDNPVEEIKQSHWFKDSYNLDPTIKAVLNMIETLFERYQNSNKKGVLFSGLKQLNFYVLSMNNFNLSDDLYIKLNARGKILSPFENLKADLFGWLSDVDEFKLLSEETTKIPLTRLENLASKFDNNWANLFWNGVNNFTKKEERKSIDIYFFKFIHRLLISNYTFQYSGTEILKDSIYNELLKKEDKILFSNLDFYIENEIISKEFVYELEIILDFYSSLDNISLIHASVSPSWNRNFGWNLFKESFSMNDRLIFDAINQYIIKNHKEPFEIQKFNEWMRISWNLIADPDIRSVTASKTVLGVIRTISQYSATIYDDLIEGKLDEFIISLSTIHKAQLEEEKLKATWIENDSEEWKEVILKAESHQLFTGNIGFILKSITSFEVFNKRLVIAEQLFKGRVAVDLISGQDYTLMRCVLSEIDDWGELTKFNFNVSEINWKTYLRRNTHTINVLNKLLSLDSLSEVTTYISNCIGRCSILNDTAQTKLAHQHLYQSNEFHSWMQSDRVNKIKWLGSHFFAIRPSAWYSKVMIDCYRNEIITGMIKEFNINQLNGHKCWNSNFYMQEQIELVKTNSSQKISFILDNNSLLRVGLKTELNPDLEVFDGEDDWIDSVRLDYTSVQNESEIPDFVKSIKEGLSKMQQRIEL